VGSRSPFRRTLWKPLRTPPQRYNLPLRRGERIHTRYETRRLLELGCIESCRPHHLSGGLLKGQKIAAMADATTSPSRAQRRGPLSTRRVLSTGPRARRISQSSNTSTTSSIRGLKNASARLSGSGRRLFRAAQRPGPLDHEFNEDFIRNIRRRNITSSLQGRLHAASQVLRYARVDCIVFFFVAVIAAAGRWHTPRASVAQLRASEIGCVDAEYPPPPR